METSCTILSAPMAKRSVEDCALQQLAVWSTILAFSCDQGKLPLVMFFYADALISLPLKLLERRRRRGTRVSTISSRISGLP